ncbi:hypothetical protein G7Y89_g8393 [Cudoniella acicularis]|uniref:Uncharacterized protein n=1 Tax=Cudoniella acicularis TaxID=354080 RepID=A0A8H4RHJ6_9HELO|nr:hypothetical protein G7Y89_g8393 [Cudoniella acicularis]
MAAIGTDISNDLGVDGNKQGGTKVKNSLVTLKVTLAVKDGRIDTDKARQATVVVTNVYQEAIPYLAKLMIDSTDLTALAKKEADEALTKRKAEKRAKKKADKAVANKAVANKPPVNKAVADKAAANKAAVNKAAADKAAIDKAVVNNTIAKKFRNIKFP